MEHITDAAIEAADIFGGQIQGKDIREMLGNAQPHILGQEFAGLRDRLVTAAGTLTADADGFTDGQEKVRLKGKAEGVRLAMSYLDEIIRSL